MRRRIITTSDLTQPIRAHCWNCAAHTPADRNGYPIDSAWHVGRAANGAPLFSCPKHRPKSATTLGDLLAAKGQRL